MTDVVVVGAGGHAKVVVEILLDCGRYRIVGLLDPAMVGHEIAGIPVIGGDDRLDALRAQGVHHAFVALGGVGDNSRRRAAYQRLTAHGFEMIQAVHARAVVSRSALLSPGVAVMASAVINAAAAIGDNVIINTGAIIEHDCSIGAHAHIAPGAIVAAGVCIAEAAHVGAGATIRQGLSVGEASVIGAGAVVVRNVPAGVVVAGVPARVLRTMILGRAGAVPKD